MVCRQVPQHTYVAKAFKPDGTTVMNTTSLWNRMKNKSRGVGLDLHHSKMMLKLHDMKQAPAAGSPSTQEIWQARLDSHVRMANDWITQLGGGEKPFLFLLYGCARCKRWTVGSNHWWRVQRRVRNLSDYSTFDGAASGSWRCCGCFWKWTWAQSGDMRLVVIGHASESTGFEPGYEFALLGKTAARRHRSEDKLF